MSAVDDAQQRKLRAEERRRQSVLRKGLVGEGEVDLSPVCGPEALSLVTRLTVECFQMAGIEIPTYTRSETPCRFVPGQWP